VALLEIRLFGDPVLRERAAEVTEFDGGLARFGDDLLATMREAHGVGLAAPQVGVLKRVFAYDVPADEEEETQRAYGVLVNPEIIQREGEQTGLEGCLSFPGLYYDCIRALSVVVAAQDVTGARLQVEGEGTLARVFQHEIDHLDGVLFIDKLSRGDRKRAMREWRERDLSLEAPDARPHVHRSDIAQSL
jgi:peptide deformylase